MPTPSIQTLRADAQQVLNLDSISAVRSVVAATLANANAGTPLNPNLTTQQLWNEFYQIVTQPKSDIESIIANQLMKFLYAPPAPGGVGADKQVIFNDGGVLAGDPQFLWNKTTNLLTVTGSATITGDLTVDTSTLKVDSANDRVGVGTASPAAGAALSVLGTTSVSASDYTNSSTWASRFQAAANNQPSGIFLSGLTSGGAVVPGSLHVEPVAASSRSALIATYAADSAVGYFAINRFSPSAGTTSQHFKIDDTGVATWSNVGGVAGTAMTLNSTGLGVGTSPAAALHAKKTLTGTASSVTNILRLDSGGSGNTAKITLTDGVTSDGYITFTGGAAADQLLGFGVQGVNQLVINNSGNVGISVTPSAWNSNYNALDIGQNGTISGRAGSSNTVDLASNGFRNTSGNWVYKLATSNTACRYQLDGSTGSHIWYSGAAGTAGNTIAGFSSALMTLDASGNLILQPPSSPPTLGTNGQLTVNATSNTNLRFSYRGSDGVTRVANITLA